MAFSYRLFDTKGDTKTDTKNKSNFTKTAKPTCSSFTDFLLIFKSRIEYFPCSTLCMAIRIVETGTKRAASLPARFANRASFRHIPSLFWSAFGQLPVLTRKMAT